MLKVYNVHTKICSTCNTEKTVDEFTKRSRSPDGIHHSCRACTRLQYRRHYEHNKDVIIENNMRRKDSVREHLQQYKQTLCCAQCGEDDPVCLDFHHDGDDKEFNISQAVSSGLAWNKIEIEINKCIVLCANCHRKAHKGNKWGFA